MPGQPISENTSSVNEQLCSKFSLAIEELPMHLDSCRDFLCPQLCAREDAQKATKLQLLACLQKDQGGNRSILNLRREWSLLSNFILRSKREVAIQLLDLTVSV